MATLTDRRMESARHIFETYRTHLHENHRCNCAEMENELKACFKLGYQEIKDIILDLLKRDRYQYLASYFMENIDTSVGVVAEYHAPLAKLYGIEWYHVDDREAKKKEFWDAFFGGGDPINERSRIDVVGAAARNAKYANVQ